ncbi:trehalose-phosphatase [Sesbania bispinosa]|nr:trehalose-phosphatase [Sesbania bispinosa]
MRQGFSVGILPSCTNDYVFERLPLPEQDCLSFSNGDSVRRRRSPVDLSGGDSAKHDSALIFNPLRNCPLQFWVSSSKSSSRTIRWTTRSNPQVIDN